MSDLVARYRCAECGARKIIDNRRLPHDHPARAQFPPRVPCLWRGCPEWAERELEPEEIRP